MIKNILNLGSILNKNEQQFINGGSNDPVTDLCIPIPREVATCLMPISGECCGLWD
ncbi:hypothetical protein [Tenacibaculum discolor]|uniref:hypothetical protein n=1 Tax=Tenacibaculum discolor TaxID=361581 RepID=UPI000F163102|nr:hypothetical protein [Tenacibaculum discolor]RLJ96413.1 hypothetical protein C8N27_3168 [Tenacibaculum discolor]